MWKIVTCNLRKNNKVTLYNVWAYKSNLLIFLSPTHKYKNNAKKQNEKILKNKKVMNDTNLRDLEYSAPFFIFFKNQHYTVFNLKNLKKLYISVTIFNVIITRNNSSDEKM